MDKNTNKIAYLNKFRELVVQKNTMTIDYNGLNYRGIEE